MVHFATAIERFLSISTMKGRKLKCHENNLEL